MSEYQLQIKQVVDYPRCRIYRQFVQSLIKDRNLRTSGGSGLFYFTVLCSYANFRTSYRRIDGISHTIYPGEWICTVKELSAWFRTRFQRQAVDILEELQKQHLISFFRFVQLPFIVNILFKIEGDSRQQNHVIHWYGNQKNLLLCIISTLFV